MILTWTHTANVYVHSARSRWTVTVPSFDEPTAREQSISCFCDQSGASDEPFAWYLVTYRCAARRNARSGRRPEGGGRAEEQGVTKREWGRGSARCRETNATFVVTAERARPYTAPREARCNVAQTDAPSSRPVSGRRLPTSRTRAVHQTTTARRSMWRRWRGPAPRDRGGSDARDGGDGGGAYDLLDGDERVLRVLEQLAGERNVYVRV